MHLPRRLFVGMLCLTTAAAAAQAGEIYKSIDADGKVVYSDHLDPSMPQSTVVQLEDPRFPPAQLHFCWTNCFTLVLDNGVYRRTDGTDESWTVETFSDKDIVLHRHDAPADWNGFSQDVVYAGQVSNDRLIGVTLNGKPVSGIDASWGTALNTLPGSNAERDATVSSTTAPPPLKEDDQPTLSQDGTLWTPGYWDWRDQGYFWVPGAWVLPPRVGVLWTPGYWGFTGAVFVFHPGHWGSTVGFYGGVNYGHGYFGNGYTGGHWIGSSFAYNSAVNHVNPAVVNHMYSEPVPNQGPKGVHSYTAGPRSGESLHTVSQHQSPMRTTVERTNETPPAHMRADKPAVAPTPAPTAPPKQIHPTTPSRSFTGRPQV
jgi:Domain of unknown function (DUF4124)/WXXGXW repeat (2 copies)